MRYRLLENSRLPVSKRDGLCLSWVACKQKPAGAGLPAPPHPGQRGTHSLEGQASEGAGRAGRRGAEGLTLGFLSTRLGEWRYEASWFMYK